jgi:hypothetical protein
MGKEIVEILSEFVCKVIFRNKTDYRMNIPLFALLLIKIYVFNSFGQIVSNNLFLFTEQRLFFK